MKRIKDLPLDERPREQLLRNGAGFLSDEALLAVVLGRGTRKQDVLALSRSIVKIIDEKGLAFEARDLLGVEGIGVARAAAISAAFEFVRRRIKPQGLKIRVPADVLPLLAHFRDRNQEHFICIALNGAHEVMEVRVVTIGLVNKSQVHPREVFAEVIALRATAVIVAHNHPSGDLNPSQEDIRMTQRLKEAAGILGLGFLDHLIFGGQGYFSFAEKGLL